MRLLSVVLVLALVLGQWAEAGSVDEHHADLLVENADDFEPAAVPACHPGVICTAFVVPEALASKLPNPAVAFLLPGPAQSLRRFGGPTITLRPPRSLA
ncbi:MAG: hypothetical protein C0524_08660 [Rhodobacter sp.]|nr:hypothetical protein [Rhodobacter sp.]